MLRAYNAAVEKLRKWRMESSRPARMVLMAMLEDGLTYRMAVTAFAEYEGKSWQQIEDEIRADMRAAGFSRIRPEALLEKCCKEACCIED